MIEIAHKSNNNVFQRVLKTGEVSFDIPDAGTNASYDFMVNHNLGIRPYFNYLVSIDGITWRPPSAFFRSAIPLGNEISVAIMWTTNHEIRFWVDAFTFGSGMKVYYRYTLYTLENSNGTNI